MAQPQMPPRPKRLWIDNQLVAEMNRFGLQVTVRGPFPEATTCLYYDQIVELKNYLKTVIRYMDTAAPDPPMVNE